MNKCRDSFLKESDEEIDFLSLHQDDVTTMAQMCVDKLAETNKSLASRLGIVKSRGLFGKVQEPKFLKGLVAFWFARKWADKIRQSKLPPRKGDIVYLRQCQGCGEDLVCPSCDLVKVVHLARWAG